MQSFSDLGNFCAHVVRKYGSPGEASEEQKAEEFRSVYLRGLPPDLRTLRAVASSCGIKLNGVDKRRMPPRLRGYHDVYEGRRNIYYRDGDAPSGIENTILHEIREMMENLFAEADPGYEPLRTSARHAVANRFAAAVLLPREEFAQKAYETGLDVIELAHLYAKSCSQVLLRLGEALQGRLFFYAALYEPAPKDARCWRVAYWTASWNDEEGDANFSASGLLFPLKGRPLQAGSLAEMALKGKRAFLARNIAFARDTDDDGLVAMARPLVVSRAVAKIALLALHGWDRQLLEPQIERAEPEVVETLWGHL